MKKYFIITLVLMSLHVVAHCQSNHTVYFHSNRYDWKDTEKESLDTWIAQHQHQKSHVVEVQGFTDSRQSDEYNQKLSERRSSHVADYLRQAGFQFVIPKYYGETRPVCAEETPECLAKNRRVECSIADQPGLTMDCFFDQKPFQVFRIPTRTECTIKGEEGTLLHFPSFGFIGKNGEAVSDSIDVHLREYYDLGEMIKAGMTTNTADGLLESGGSIEVKAYDQGAELNFQNGKYFGITFKNKQLNDGMETFYGSLTPQVNEPIGPQSIGSQSSLIMEKLVDNTKPRTNVNTTTDAWVGSNVYSEYQFISVNTASLDISQADLVSWVQNNFAYDYILRDAQLYAGKNIRERADSAVKATIERDKIKVPVRSMREVQDYPFFGASYTNGALELDGVRYNALYKRKPEFVYEAPKGDTMIRNEMGPGSYNSEAVPPANQIIISNQLGFINCDRWSRSGLPLCNVNVKAERNTAYFLVFPDIHAVMPGMVNVSGDAYFKNIPRGKEAVLIALRFAPDQNAMLKETIVCKEHVDVKPLETAPLSEVQNALNDPAFKF